MYHISVAETYQHYKIVSFDAGVDISGGRKCLMERASKNYFYVFLYESLYTWLWMGGR